MSMLHLPLVWAGQRYNPHTGKPDLCSTFTEEDGSPSMTGCQTVEVTDGTLTDDGDGNFSLSISGGSGDVTDVGDCATGACFTGTTGNTLTFKGATSGTIALKPAAVAGTNTLTMPAETGTVCTTGSVCSGYGDITSVGDVASGAAFDGTQGTTLTFNNVGGDSTLSYNGTTMAFDKRVSAAESVTNASVTALTLAFDATYSVSGARQVRAIDIGLSSTGSANNTDEQTAIVINNSKDAGNGTLAELGGIDLDVDASSSVTSTITYQYGQDVLVSGSVDNGAVSTTMAGISLIVDAALSDFTNLYGVKVAVDGDAGSVGTNRYALHITDGSQAVGGTVSNDYGIYQVGTNLNVFGGAITVAATDPADAGSIRLDNNEAIAWEASPAGTDVTLSVDASELFQFSTGVTTAGDLTVTGGDITLGTTSIFSGGDTASLNNVDAVDATTEATLEAALDIGGEVTSTGMASTVIGDTISVSSWTIATPIFTGAYDLNNVAVDDDDCTGQQGQGWYDSTDSAWEFCNANSGAPATLAAASGDITDVYNCASGDCASIAMADGDLLNASSVSVTTTTEGIILPQHATACTSATAEGQVCWEADADNLWVGDGAAAKQMNGGGTDTNADKEFWWPAPATLPLEAADSIPPIAKDAGTNLDLLTTDFDQSTDECRTVDFIVPADITSGGTVTFTAIWYAASVTSNNVIWDFRHNSGVAEGVDPDASLTTEAASADAVQGTAGQITITTWTETQTNLGWAASDLVVGEFCRDANNASDNFAADAKVIGFGIRIPRS